MLRIAPGEEAREDLAVALGEICRQGAERMLAAALEAEVQDRLERQRACRDEAGLAQVVRNGLGRTRQVVTATGSIEVSAPRVDDRRVDPATGSAPGSAARSCRRMSAAPRRSSMTMIMRAGLIELLTGEPGIEIVGQASTGREAIERARRLAPDVVVMDVRMPDLDGIAATSELARAVPGARVLNPGLLSFPWVF